MIVFCKVCVYLKLLIKTAGKFPFIFEAEHCICLEQGLKTKLMSHTYGK